MLVSCWLTLTLLCKGSIANPTSSPYTSSYTSTQNGTQKEPTNTSREDNQTSAGTTTPPSVIPMSRNECSAGTYFSFKERTCIDCPRDSVSVAGSFSCTICSLGSFPNKERTACGRFSVVDSEGKRQVEGQLGVLLYEEVPAITKTTTTTTTTTTKTTTLPGTVCDDRFSQNSAVAICKLMGYEDSLAVAWKYGLIYDIQRNYEIKLDEVKCPTPYWSNCTYFQDHDCSHYEDVLLNCNATGVPGHGFKLINSAGEISKEGWGLLLYNGGTVCKNSFTIKAARAICRVMGFSPQMYLTRWYARDLFSIQSNFNPSITDITCFDDDWSSCRYSNAYSRCYEWQNVFLDCKVEVGFSLVDSDGNRNTRGLGLLIYNGGTVCDRRFSTTEARAICREMGFNTSADSLAATWYSGKSSSIQHHYVSSLAEVSCLSESWTSCTTDENFLYTSSACFDRNNVFLVCRELKLVDARGYKQAGGKGLLLYGNRTVCGDGGFDTTEAEEICKDMGYDSNTVSWETGEKFGFQNEYQSSRQDCSHSADIFLDCNYSSHEFTLKETAKDKSLLLYNGGTVCYIGFDTTAAKAICRELGYSNTDSVEWDSGRIYYWQSDYPVKLEGVSCPEEDWNSCAYRTSPLSCTHFGDVFISCEAKSEPRFMLRNSVGNAINADAYGLLLYKGGTVCDDEFDTITAKAVCKEMGLDWSGARWSSRHRYKEGVHMTSYEMNLQITLDNLKCSRDDWSSCRFSESHDCTHSEDIFLQCREEGANSEFSREYCPTGSHYCESEQCWVRTEIRKGQYANGDGFGTTSCYCIVDGQANSATDLRWDFTENDKTIKYPMVQFIQCRANYSYDIEKLKETRITCGWFFEDRQSSYKYWTGINRKSNKLWRYGKANGIRTVGTPHDCTSGSEDAGSSIVVPIIIALIIIAVLGLIWFCRMKCCNQSLAEHQQSAPTNIPDGVNPEEEEAPQPPPPPPEPSTSRPTNPTLLRIDSIPTYTECVTSSDRVVSNNDYVSLPTEEELNELPGVAPPSYEEVQEHSELYTETAMANTAV